MEEIFDAIAAATRCAPSCTSHRLTRRRTRFGGVADLSRSIRRYSATFSGQKMFGQSSSSTEISSYLASSTSNS